MTTRDRTPEPPYCWQSKEARRAIRERMNGHESTSATLSLYDALTEIASNEGVESFKAGQRTLSMNLLEVSSHEGAQKSYGLIVERRANETAS